MDIFEVIEARCSVRQFKEAIPPLADVKKIINAARLAPSSTNSQMWHFVVVYNPNLRSRMKKAVEDIYDEMTNWEEAAGMEDKVKRYKQYSTFFTEAPVNIAVLMKPKSSPIEELLRKRGFSEKEILRNRPNPSLLSIGAAIENLSLVAHAMGYGSCWLTGPLYAYKKLEEILDIKPPYELVSLLCLGIPLDERKNPTPKKELSEILTIIE